jgi:hypothetical protein
MFVWTPELEASCPPVRGQGAPVESKPIDDKKLVAAAGIAGKPEGHAAEAQAFLQACNTKGIKLVAGAVDRLFARYGAAGAVEIFALVGKAGVSFMGPIREATVARVRHHLAHATDYQAALDFVVGHGGLPPGLDGNPTQYQIGHELVAYLFPDHRPFFDAAIEHLIAGNFRTTSYLLGAVASADDVPRFGPRGIGHQDWERHAVVVARVAREAGLPFLVAYTSRSTGVPGVARALTAYVSPEAATALALYVENKDALAILRRYFAAHPELAAALEPHAASKKKKIRDAATSLLDAARST